MRTFIALFVLTTGLSGVALAQSDSTPVRKAVVYTVVDVPPRYPGGMSKFNTYLRKNLRYPEAARNARIEGRVFVSFIVTDQGAVEEVKILKGSGYRTEEEAERLVNDMPKWEPGKLNGMPVNVRYNVVVPFELR